MDTEPLHSSFCLEWGVACCADPLVYACQYTKRKVTLAKVLFLPSLVDWKEIKKEIGTEIRREIGTEKVNKCITK